MRLSRGKLPNQSVVHHCTSRLVAEVPFLQPHEKRYLRQRMRKLAAFCQMRVINHTVMGNHYHILNRSPKKVRLSDAQLLAKVRAYNGPRSPQFLELQEALNNQPARARQLRKGYLARMGDISVFMKELKEGFTRWYNRLHDRKGILWGRRFHSQVVEDHPLCLQAVSAYIDLNAVRTRQVKDPKNYSFCGYAEAEGGGKMAREGLGEFLPPGRWAKRLAAYRMYLYGEGGQARHSGKAVLSPEEIARVLSKGGRLSLAQVLRCRVRYFTDGAVLGSKEFVDRVWRECYGGISPKRKSGARKMKGADWGGLHVLRDLQKDVIS